MKTQTAIKFFKSREKLARHLGVDRSLISHWGEDVPYLRQCQLQVETRGRLKADKREIPPKV